jgi:hypothetical protein
MGTYVMAGGAAWVEDIVALRFITLKPLRILAGYCGLPDVLVLQLYLFMVNGTKKHQQTQ